MSNAAFHDANPSVVVTDYIRPSRFKFKFPKVKIPIFKIPNTKTARIITFIAALLLVIGLGVAIAFVIKQNTTPKEPQGPLTYKDSLEQTMKETFTDPRDEDILRYIQFASDDNTLKSKFVDYSNAYQLIYQRYENSATVPIRKALLKLKTFLRAFPQYKDEDFKLLK